MRKWGFKVFSTNLQTTPELIRECAEFASHKSDIFIELTAITNSTKEDFIKIKEQTQGVEIRIHASQRNFNPADKKREQQNREIVAFAQKTADIFDSKTIIVHGGYGHGRQYVEETARQFKLFNDKRIVVENLPYYDNNGDPLHGYNAEEINYIMQESGCGFCFDFSHAICSAASLKQDIDTYLKDFFALNPTVYHICDGHLSSIKDLHLHFGSGDYPLKHFITDFTDENAYITIETGKGLEKHRTMRVRDYNFIKSIS